MSEISHTATTLCLPFIRQLEPQLCNGGAGFPPHHSTMLSINSSFLIILCAGLMQFFPVSYLQFCSRQLRCQLRYRRLACEYHTMLLHYAFHSSGSWDPSCVTEGLDFRPIIAQGFLLATSFLIIWCAGLMQFVSLCFIDRGKVPDWAASQSFFRNTKNHQKVFVETDHTDHNILSFSDAEDHEQNAVWITQFALFC